MKTRAGLLVAGFGLILVACSDATPSRVRLVELESQLLPSPTSKWLCMPQTLGANDWSAGPWPGSWTALLCVPGTGHTPTRSSPHALEVDGHALRELQLDPSADDLEGQPDDSFAVVGDELYYFDSVASFADKEVLYQGWIERPSTPHVTLPGVTCDGWLLETGESLTLELPDVRGRDAELVFGMRVYGSERGARPSEVVLRLDGHELFRATEPAKLLAGPSPHRVKLPGYAGGRLTVDVRLGDGVVQLVDPVLRQADRAHPPERAPDVGLFGFDGLDAEELSAWVEGAPARPGRAGAATPSILQVLATGAAEPMSLPARFATAGYRTLAVAAGTASLDRGFELVLASGADLPSALALDDGRPLFLHMEVSSEATFAGLRARLATGGHGATHFLFVSVGAGRLPLVLVGPSGATPASAEPSEVATTLLELAGIAPPELSPAD